MDAYNLPAKVVVPEMGRWRGPLRSRPGSLRDFSHLLSAYCGCTPRWPGLTKRCGPFTVVYGRVQGVYGLAHSRHTAGKMCLVLTVTGLTARRRRDEHVPGGGPGEPNRTTAAGRMARETRKSGQPTNQPTRDIRDTRIEIRQSRFASRRERAGPPPPPLKRTNETARRERHGPHSTHTHPWSIQLSNRRATLSTPPPPPRRYV